MPANREFGIGLLDEQPRPAAAVEASDLVVAFPTASQPGLEPARLLERHDRVGRLADPVAEGEQQVGELVERSGAPAARDVLDRVEDVVDRLSDR
jgi:hypothetical protein